MYFELWVENVFLTDLKRPIGCITSTTNSFTRRFTFEHKLYVISRMCHTLMKMMSTVEYDKYSQLHRRLRKRLRCWMLINNFFSESLENVAAFKYSIMCFTDMVVSCSSSLLVEAFERIWWMCSSTHNPVFFVAHVTSATGSQWPSFWYMVGASTGEMLVVLTFNV